MGEQASSDQQLFAAEAAQKARDLLSEPRRADEGGVHAKGTILDADGVPIHARAANFVADIKQAEKDEELFSGDERKLRSDATLLRQVAEGVERPDGRNSATVEGIRDQADERIEEANGMGTLARTAGLRQKAIELDATKHLANNRAEYETAALEDATEAHKSISWDTRLTDARTAQELGLPIADQPTPLSDNDARWVDGADGSFLKVDTRDQVIDMRLPDEHES